MTLAFATLIALFIGLSLLRVPAAFAMPAAAIALPAVAALGIDPVYFGVLIIFNSTIGLVMPPHRLLLFILAALTRIPLREIFRESWLLVAGLLACLFALVAFPDLVMALPRALGYVK